MTKLIRTTNLRLTNKQPRMIPSGESKKNIDRFIEQYSTQSKEEENEALDKFLKTKGNKAERKKALLGPPNK